jgi:hypothetical protein
MTDLQKLARLAKRHEAASERYNEHERDSDYNRMLSVEAQARQMLAGLTMADVGRIAELLSALQGGDPQAAVA